tara:strand:+ start:8858 stop:9751 length:894 start_codon:yes stop_codon:yes gene_type:complete
MDIFKGFDLKPGTGMQVGIQGAGALLSGWQAQRAKVDYGNKMNEIKNYEASRQKITNAFGAMENPYKNLAVATQAAEIQMEQTDQALATTLDTLRATGASAGGATALANAALKSKQGISASIEQQEVNNQKLKAQGQLQVDIAKGKGEIKRMEMQEAREVSQLDRLQSQADLLRGQQLESQSAMISGIGGMGKAFTAGMVSQDRENPNDGNSYVNESGININDPKYNINNNDDMSFDNITLNDDDDPSQVNELDTKEFQNPLNNLNVNNSLAAGVTNNNNGYVPIIDLDEASQIDSL